ncbi:MAG: MlaD family protein [Desulfobulbaceae bacterium]|nr:MlaD family protein [Desulfobulbaceae bacterium]
MTTDTDYKNTMQQIPTSSIRKSKGLSIVWLVPLVALAIASWLMYTSLTGQGPEIMITFKNAEGIEAGSSKIKYKDVEIGAVTAITFSPDMRDVVVKARMEKIASRYLTDSTRFWIVRPKVSAGQISGLGTLLSGSYIGIDPGRTGNPRANFTGLEETPIVTAEVPGNTYILKADGLGSLDIGTPVYYRQIKVGQVIGYGFADNGKDVNITIFVNSPHDKQITTDTRFWNASGINLDMNATGIKLATESLATIITGGIAFESLPGSRPSETVASNTVFELYSSKDGISEEKFQQKDTWLLYFSQSVRGLTVGAPVEFRGIKIGKVSSIALEFNRKELSFRTPVSLTIEPERIFGRDVDFTTDDGHALLKEFIAHGLRGILKNGNLLTGQLLIDFDFYPDETKKKMTYESGIPVLPTKQTELEEITENLSSTLKKMAGIPFTQISQDLQTTLQTISTAIGQIPVQELSQDLRTTIQSTNSTMQQIDQLSKTLDSQTLPIISKTLEQLGITLAGLDASLGSDSPANYQLRQTMREVSTAVRSLRGLTDYLERHPESLIYGKENERP